MVRSLAAKLPPKLARFGALNLPGPIEPEAMEKFLQKKAALQQDIEQMQTQLQKHKTERANLDHHLPLGQVPEAERFDRLSSGRRSARRPATMRTPSTMSIHPSYHSAKTLKELHVARQLALGNRPDLVSAYTDRRGVKFWIITEADRRATRG